MLPNSEECSPGPLVCCDTLFSAGESIRDHALSAINNPDCYLDACHAPNMEGIVTIGAASSYPQANLLTVSLQQMLPRQTQPAQGRTPGAITYLATWNVEFIESGWMTFEEAGGIPEPDYLQMLAMHSYSHLEQVFRRLTNAIATGTIVDGCKGGNCGASMGPLFPIDPSGHLVGWRFTVTVPVDFSKVCSGPAPS